MTDEGLFCDSQKFRYRFKTLYNEFKNGSVSYKWWSADHGLQATDTLGSVVDTLALITRLFEERQNVTSAPLEFRRNKKSRCYYLSISIKMDICVFSSITLERMERIRAYLVHILLYVCVRILFMFVRA
jgi:hypothetical protein